MLVETCIHSYVQLEKDIFICKNCDLQTNFARGNKTPVHLSPAYITKVNLLKNTRKFIYSATIAQENRDHLRFTSSKQYNQFGQPLHNILDLQNLNSRTH